MHTKTNSLRPDKTRRLLRLTNYDLIHLREAGKLRFEQ